MKLPVFILFCLSAFSLFAQPTHAPHQHGGGQVNVAVEKNILLLEVTLPAVNVLGFEHPARNSTEKRLIRQAVKNLKNANHLFRINEEAGCKLDKAAVETDLQKPDSHATHNHESDTHSDFTASYQFNCNKPSQLRRVETILFKVYPATEYLELQLLSDSLQRGGRISPKESFILFQ